MKINKRWLVAGIILILFLVLAWLATTDNTWIWPVRNTIQYRLLTLWQQGPMQPVTGIPGTLQGTVVNAQNIPIEGARILVAQPDGTTHSARSDAAGQYQITDIPPGRYRPVAGAPGYENVQFGGFFKRITIRSGTIHTANVTLPPKTPRAVSPGQDFWLSDPKELGCTHPIESRGIRRQIHFTSDGTPNQPSFYYTPITATTSNQLPTLLVIYPGPSESWECASLPLADAGYAVIATGPAYSFDLEADIDEQERILNFAREQKFPGSDGGNIAILGGSYSSLHVQQLLQRGQPAKAAVLLGPPTDLFDMRRRLENGTYVPPFGLDQALIALGLPNQEPMHYWPYSGAYHVRSDFPPLAILHSRNDEVVPYQQSELLATNLEQVGAAYEVHVFDGASHYLLDDGADEVYQIALEFLAKHMQQ